MQLPRGWGLDFCIHLAAPRGFTDTAHLINFCLNLIHLHWIPTAFPPDIRGGRNSAAAKWPQLQRKVRGWG